MAPRVRRCRSGRLAEIWQQHLDSLAATDGSSGSSFLTDVATQTQRLTLDIVGLTAFSHDFQQVQRIADDLSGAAGDSMKATDRLLWAVNAFGEALAEVREHVGRRVGVASALGADAASILCSIPTGMFAVGVAAPMPERGRVAVVHAAARGKHSPRAGIHSLTSVCMCHLCLLL